MVILRTIITVLFALDCIGLVIVVLMQEGKQKGLGALGGGMQDTYWGKNKGRSAEGNLVKLTRAMAIVFVVLALVLNINF